MKKVCLLAACVLALFSCQKEQNVPEGDGVVPKGYTKLTLKAVSDVTKTTLTLDEGGETGTVKWAAEDKIKVICEDGPVTDPFEIVDGVGTTDGSFAGYIPAGKTALHTVYPAASYSAVSGATVKVVVPASQSGDFGSCNIAVANVAADHSMAFRNVNAFISFAVPAGVTKVVVSSVDESPLAGKLSVDCSGTYPAATTTYEITASSITATLAGTAGTYYVSALPGQLHAKGLLFEYFEGETKTGTYWLNKKITTGVNNVYGMGEVSTSGDYYVTEDGGEEVKNGMSWATAWSASQFWSKIHPAGSDAAIDNAKLANINGATFHFAEGTYNWGPGAAISINGVSFKVEGGYNASTGERDIENNKTKFTGDDGNDGTGDHRILFIDGDLNITFDGITFTKGVTSGSGDARFGGGVFIRSGSHSFIDCAFNDNSAKYGGALRFESSGNLALTRTAFSNNAATNSGDGGALSLSSGTITITGGSYTGNSAVLGGAIDCSGTAVVSIYGGEFSGNSAVNNGGAIAVEAGATLKVNPTGTASTQFINNSCTKYGGALDIESGKDNVIENKIRNAIFKGNHARDGGAVATDGATVDKKRTTTKVIFNDCIFGGSESGDPNYVTKAATDDAHGGAILAENESFINIAESSFTGNFADNNQYGGAICARGGALVRLFDDAFIGNYAGTGGVAYTETSSAKHPKLFIDECSFDANYITNGKGAVFNIAGADSFIMHNSSVRGSYLSAEGNGEAACWIDFDGIQNCTSISNSTIIGDAASSALVWACTGSWNNYFTNNIITSSSSTTKSIYSNGSPLNMSYNHYYSCDYESGTTITNDNGVSECLSGSIDGLEWSNTGSTFYYWKWDGTFNSSAPTKTTKDAVSTRVNTASSAFMTWSDSDFVKDQRGVGRGNGNWWPGAYQN